MYEILKKLLPAAEEIGTVMTIRQTDSRDRRFYNSDEIDITGVLDDGRKFSLSLEVIDKKEDTDAS